MSTFYLLSVHSKVVVVVVVVVVVCVVVVVDVGVVVVVVVVVGVVVVDRFYMALFSALEQAHCASMCFCMSD